MRAALHGDGKEETLWQEVLRDGRRSCDSLRDKSRVLYSTGDVTDVTLSAGHRGRCQNQVNCNYWNVEVVTKIWQWNIMKPKNKKKEKVISWIEYTFFIKFVLVTFFF